MILSSAQLIHRIHETKAVSIWNHKTGPIFWYAASVPGPFYVNTELVIGPALSASLLKSITQIVETIAEAPARAEALEKLIMQAYEGDETYKNIIDTMVSHALRDFPAGTVSLISGGERRDWLFSIPLAKLAGLRHVYLFKNGTAYCAQPIKAGEKALHVADLINNAASYFDNWLPILQKEKLECQGTLCVNSRGSNGVDRLTQAGVKVVALNSVDVGFFERSLENGLIDAATLEELKVFFKSAQEWAEAYVLGRPELFDPALIDAKSFERMKTFFSKDPWNLREKNAAFFAQMDAAIKERMAKQG